MPQGLSFMKKITFGAFILASMFFAGCGSNSNEQITNKEACERTLCTSSQCFVWDAELKRCGTADALKKEHRRLERSQMTPEEMEKKHKHARIPDSLLNVEIKKANLKRIIKVATKTLDSLNALDNGKSDKLLAAKFIREELELKKLALDSAYNSKMDTIAMLSLINGKPITAKQWVDYNKRQTQKKLEKLNKPHKPKKDSK